MGKMIKQRQESLEIYEKAGRAELAAQEREEIEIISAYLPKKMSDLEAGDAISDADQGNRSRDASRTWAAPWRRSKQRFAGQMDFAKAERAW